MRRIWGRPTSANVMKVVWLLEELQLPYERVDAGGEYGRTDTPEYRALNPNRSVPVLQEDNYVLWESNAILRYLCSAWAPDLPLWPRNPQARGSIDRWMDWQQTVLNAPQAALFWGLVRTPPAERDAAAIAAAAAKAGHAWTLLDEILGKAPYVAGPAFTLADIALGVHVHRWFSFAIEGPELAGLRAWYGRLLERPPYRRFVAGPVR
ncbi:MAG TPA: glutathione S-transferase family protein [Acetobacteraceae bacterium]|nr:glutathione S-transferase family protein [Acetobacteraceae bacterium]